MIEHTTPSFQIDALSFSYPSHQSASLKNINISVFSGEFVVLCGKSGSGKTTLLRHFKKVLTPHGTSTGKIYFEGMELNALSQGEQSQKIGFVLQNPDNQIVTDKVWHELAFGLESLGYDTAIIRKRTAEIASFFGIQTWFHQNVSELSGGQKQLLNLASIMVMQPSVLILDEPTSQLDPIAAGDFLAMLAKINRELGTTILLTEHRLEEALPLSSRVLVMDSGSIIADGTAKEVGMLLKEKNHDIFSSFPVPMRIFSAVPNSLPCPVTVKEGRDWLSHYAENYKLLPLASSSQVLDHNTPAISLENTWFRYEKNLPDIIKGLQLSVPSGAFYALVGGNGTGKSTMLSLISGENLPYRGTVRLYGKNSTEFSDFQETNSILGVLPQNPQTLFIKKTVKLDLYEILSNSRFSKKIQDEKIAQITSLCELEHLMDRHPYDLSGGEQQRAALAKILLLEPKILLLDEPTKGLDSQFKNKLAHILKQLQASGTTILMVSHDIEFCAKYTDYCAMFFDGAIISDGPPKLFFTGNNFYTTAANRMAKHLLPEAITAEDIISACGIEIAPPPEYKPMSIYKEIPPMQDLSSSQTKISWKRKLAAAVLLAISLTLSYALVSKSLPLFSSLPSSFDYGIYTLLLIFCTANGLFLLRADSKNLANNPSLANHHKKLSKRTMMAIIMILFFIPLTIFIGYYYLGDRKYYFISMLIILETMLPFLIIFENRKPQARELVIIAMLCAIAVAGRSAFFFLPQFKPVAALIIICGVAFGGETGFLVGAISMFISNMFYGQGPWTPWQMFAMGIIGFIAGILFQKGFFSRSKISLSIFGFLATFFIYGGIINPSSVLIFQPNPSLAMILSSYVTAIPMDLVHAFSTFCFLFIGGPSMLEKLDRIKLKYAFIKTDEK